MTTSLTQKAKNFDSIMCAHHAIVLSLYLCQISAFHRITEYAELEGTHKDHQVQLLALHRIITPCALRVLSKCFLNFVRLVL